MSERRFPPPWTVETIPGGLKVSDANGQSLAYVYSRENPNEAHMAKVLTEDEARTCSMSANDVIVYRRSPVRARPFASNRIRLRLNIGPSPLELETRAEDGAQLEIAMWQLSHRDHRVSRCPKWEALMPIGHQGSTGEEGKDTGSTRASLRRVILPHSCRCGFSHRSALGGKADIDQPMLTNLDS
jgi:hypothetical protein